MHLLLVRWGKSKISGTLSLLIVLSASLWDPHISHQLSSVDSTVGRTWLFQRKNVSEVRAEGIFLIFPYKKKVKNIYIFKWAPF